MAMDYSCGNPSKGTGNDINIIEAFFSEWAVCLVDCLSSDQQCPMKVDIHHTKKAIVEISCIQRDKLKPEN